MLTLLFLIYCSTNNIPYGNLDLFIVAGGDLITFTAGGIFAIEMYERFGIKIVNLKRDLKDKDAKIRELELERLR
jgi:hypothetical protein